MGQFRARPRRSPMLIRHVGIVSESDSVLLPELTEAAAAVQKQDARDFGPLWNVKATVAAFGALENVPTDYWPIIIKDDIQKSVAGGVHRKGEAFARGDRATDEEEKTMSE